MTKIDWTKPIELTDGTPLKLSDRKNTYLWDSNPDGGGDYWVRREDGKVFGHGYGPTVVDACLSPNGEEGIVRNRTIELKSIPDYLTLIRQWADDRNLILGSTEARQSLKLIEEFGETCAAHARGNADCVKDGIGDCIVVMTIINAQRGTKLTIRDQDVRKFHANEVARCIGSGFYGAATTSLAGLAKEYGLTLVECIAAAWDEIKDRKGFMRDGVFIKEGE